MSKSFKKFIAVVSAIAMVVTSLTVYNSTAKAETDYSSLTYNYKKSGTTYLKGSESSKVPWKVAIDESQSQGEIINWMTTGAGYLNFYGEMYMSVVWHANYPKAVLEINGKTVEQGGEGVQVFADAEIHVNAKTWIENNAYNVVKVTSADGTQYITFVVATGDKAVDPNESTTELQKPSAPTGLVANINDLKTNYTIAFGNVDGATSYKFYLDGTYKQDITNGGIVTISELGLTAGQTYTFGVSAVNAAGESDRATFSVTVPAAEQTTTPSESEGQEETTTVAEEFDPSTITSWTPVTGSTTLSYYIADGADTKVNVKPEMHGNNLYAAFALAAKFSSVTLNDKVITPREGADIEIAKTSFVEGYNKLVVVNYYGNESVTIYVKADKEEETTTKAYVDGEVLVNDSGVKEVPAYESGDYWQNEFNNAPVTYVAGKKYVAEVVVSSTAAKTIKLVFQRVKIWDFVDAAKGYEATIQAGNKVKITYVFEATQGTDNGNFDIYLGSVAKATTLVFESKKLTTYTEVPEGVVTGVEVLSAPTVTEYNVTVDGGEATKVAENGTYTLPTDATYGYYCNGEMYKAGAEVTVTTDMAFTSVNTLAVAFDAEGKAGIKLNGANTSGIRYQATVTSNNMDAVSSSAIVEGMLITANDIYENNNSELTLASTYTVKNIVNSGWYKDTTGTYCGSIVNIVESNYIRNFIAKAYVTVNYTDGTSTTVYSGVSKVRSIAEVAQKLIAAGALGKYTTEEQAVIQAFAAAK